MRSRGRGTEDAKLPILISYTWFGGQVNSLRTVQVENSNTLVIIIIIIIIIHGCLMLTRETAHGGRFSFLELRFYRSFGDGYLFSSTAMASKGLSLRTLGS